MTMNIAKEVAALGRMTVKDLREKYVEVFGERTRSGTRTTWSNGSPGGCRPTPRATCPNGPARAEELANDADLRLPPRRQTTASDRRPHDGRDASPSARTPPADAGHGPDPAIQGRDRRGPRAGGRASSTRRGLPHAVGRRQGRHRLPLERLPLLRTCREGSADEQADEAPDVRCAIYTRKSHRGGPRTGVQLPRRPARSGRGVHRQPEGRGLGLPARPLRRRRLHRRQHGAAGAEAAAGRHRGRARSTASWSTRSTGSAAR